MCTALICHPSLFKHSSLQIKKLYDSFKITQTALAGKQLSHCQSLCLCSPAMESVLTPSLNKIRSSRVMGRVVDGERQRECKL